MKLFYLFLFIKCVLMIQMLAYKPGKYIIKRKDYKYAKNIIVELWGGGGNGSVINRGCRGGGSGAYIKVSLSMINKGNILLIVGKEQENTSFSTDQTKIIAGKGYDVIIPYHMGGKGGEYYIEGDYESALLSSGNQGYYDVSFGDTKVTCNGGVPNIGKGGICKGYQNNDNIQIVVNATLGGGGCGYGKGGQGAAIIYF
jgi:hypothetical protein